MWIECANSGQVQAWETAELIWHKTTDRDWPPITMGLIHGLVALTFKHDANKDSKRIQILIAMMTWTIWKVKIKMSINDQEVHTHETSQILKELITRLIRNSWNATHFMEEKRKLK